MVIMIIECNVKPEKRDEFLKVIEHDAVHSEHDEPGCLRFDVLNDLEDPNKFFFYEVYKDEAAFQAHTKTPHLAAWRAAAAEVCEGPSTRITTKSVFPRDGAYWGV